MGFSLLEYDKQLAAACSLVLVGNINAGVAANQNANGKKNQSTVARDVGRGKIASCNGTRIIFQFPPRVTSDSKTGEWSSVKNAALPPIAYYKATGPRKISLKWEYIVTHGGDGKSGEDGIWGVPAIANNVRTIRGYFNLGLDSADSNSFNPENMIIFFKYGAFGDGSAQYQGFTGGCYTFYAEAVDVKHSDTLVYPSSDLIYPLKTEVSMTLIEWTSGLLGDKNNNAANIKLLVTKPTPGWY